MGLSIANSRDIYKINAKINAIIGKGSLDKIVFPVMDLEPFGGAGVISREEANKRRDRQLDHFQRH
jgi:hypothetical protein